MANYLTNNAIWLGKGGTPESYNESATDPFASGQLGKVFSQTREITGVTGTTAPSTKIFQIVQLHSGATAALGAVVIWQDKENYVVTTAASNTAANSGLAAGILLSGSITAGNLCCIQVGGLGHILEVSGTAQAIGDWCTSVSATAGRAGKVAVAGPAPASPSMGVYHSVEDSGGTDLGEVMLMVYRNGW